MRFTTSKESGDPHAHISCRLPEGFAVIIEEGNHVLADIARNDILFYFLLQNVCGILIDLNDTIDLSVDVVMEHLLYSHLSLPPTILNAR